jgi:hypothetical protein
MKKVSGVLQKKEWWGILSSSFVLFNCFLSLFSRLPSPTSRTVKQQGEHSSKSGFIFYSFRTGSVSSNCLNPRANKEKLSGPPHHTYGFIMGRRERGGGSGPGGGSCVTTRNGGGYTAPGSESLLPRQSPPNLYPRRKGNQVLRTHTKV